MRISIVTDAWFPQVNGVVRSLAATVAELDRRGHEVKVISPERFRTVPMPGYPSIRLALMPRFSTRKQLGGFGPDVVHIATEGPIGWSARGWCKSHNVPFSSAFHTRFPDYAAVRTGIKADRFWPLMRRFHASSRAVMVATQGLENELEARGFKNLCRWSRGIHAWRFRPTGRLHSAMEQLPRPIMLNVGRVAPEKNLDAFLSAKVPGTKVVVGDGPALAEMRQRYPDTVFLGELDGEELSSAYRSADCFVFPSLTDTFGLVLIEALACGLPVAAFPVGGPLDVLGREGCGPANDLAAPVAALDDNIELAIAQALQFDRTAAAKFGAQHSWERATDQFIAGIQQALANRKNDLGPERELELA